eukprot:6179319-Pleurochrysis_carterae.AAC.3
MAATTASEEGGSSLWTAADVVLGHNNEEQSYMLGNPIVGVLRACGCFFCVFLGERVCQT